MLIITEFELVISFINSILFSSIPYLNSLKQLVELLPGILTQLGPEHTERLRKYADQIQAQESGKLGTVEEGDDDDDDVPELVENFEEAAK